MRQIKNGRAYPKSVKLAALKASKSKAGKKRTIAAIAADFNVSPSTLTLWRQVAGISKPISAGLAAYHAAQAAIKVTNTPTVTSYVTDAGTTAQGIMLKGVLYK